MVQIFVQASGRNLPFILNDFLNYKKIDIFNPFPHLQCIVTAA